MVGVWILKSEAQNVVGCIRGFFDSGQMAYAFQGYELCVGYASSQDFTVLEWDDQFLESFFAFVVINSDQHRTTV